MNDQSPQIIIIIPLLALLILVQLTIKLTSIILIQVLDFANYLINYRHLPYLIYKQRNTIDNETLYRL